MLQSCQIRLMGTTIDVQIEDDFAAEKLKLVVDLLYLYNHRFSANDENSELSAINKNAGKSDIVVHPQLFELIKIGKLHSLSNPSNLNIALGPLVKSWKIGFDGANLPTNEVVKSALALSNPEAIILDESNLTVFLSKAGMEIDLGALAKGFIADLIMAELKAQKVKSALINLGGNVLVHGENPNRLNGNWKIGIQNPQQNRHEHIGNLTIHNKSVVTSGIYERFLTKNGKTYHHIFDRNTGFPIDSEMVSLTIIADKSLDCEIWTTRLFGLPISLALEQINQNPKLDGIIIDKENHIFLSDFTKCSFVPLIG